MGKLEPYAVCRKHLRASLQDIRRDLEATEDGLVRIGNTLVGGDAVKHDAPSEGIKSGAVLKDRVVGVADQVYFVEDQAARVRNYAKRVEEILDGYEPDRGAASIEIPGPNRR